MVGLLRSVGNKMGPDFSDPHELCNPRQALDGRTVGEAKAREARRAADDSPICYKGVNELMSERMRFLPFKATRAQVRAYQRRKIAATRSPACWLVWLEAFGRNLTGLVGG